MTNEIQVESSPVLMWHNHAPFIYRSYPRDEGAPLFWYSIEIDAGELALYYKSEGGKYRFRLAAEKVYLALPEFMKAVFSLTSFAQAHHLSVRDIE